MNKFRVTVRLISLVSNSLYLEVLTDSGMLEYSNHIGWCLENFKFIEIVTWDKTVHKFATSDIFGVTIKDITNGEEVPS